MVTSTSVSFLPGMSDPEVTIFEDIAESLDTLVGRLTVMLQLPSSEQQSVRQSVGERRLTNMDRHIIFGQIGDDLDFTSEIVVQRAFVNCWAQANPDKVDQIWNPILSKLPRIGSES